MSEQNAFFDNECQSAVDAVSRRVKIWLHRFISVDPGVKANGASSALLKVQYFEHVEVLGKLHCVCARKPKGIEGNLKCSGWMTPSSRRRIIIYTIKKKMAEERRRISEWISAVANTERP